MPLNQADTCRVYVTPKLREAEWETLPHSLTEQYIFTDGRVEFKGNQVKRGEQKRADYLIRYTRDYPIAVVEAKPEGDPVGKGIEAVQNSVSKQNT